MLPCSQKEYWEAQFEADLPEGSTGSPRASVSDGYSAAGNNGVVENDDIQIALKSLLDEYLQKQYEVR